MKTRRGGSVKPTMSPQTSRRRELTSERQSAGRHMAPGVVRDTGRGRPSNAPARPGCRWLHHLHARPAHVRAVRAGRPWPLAVADWAGATAAEIATAARDYFAYCGTY